MGMPAFDWLRVPSSLSDDVCGTQDWQGDRVGACQSYQRSKSCAADWRRILWVLFAQALM
jgi:hypothetical protein